MRGLAKTEGTKFLAVHPVSRIPTAFSKSTSRGIFGRVTQTLTGHGYTTGEYYKRMHLRLESPWCPCSLNPDTPVLMSRLHAIQECDRIIISTTSSVVESVQEMHHASWTQPGNSTYSLSQIFVGAGHYPLGLNDYV